ncbi:MAG: glycosyltransferase, partial [Simkaniaceae bacterium]|nr:glycosyltransferase [Simkaniaceae bacterium]
DKKWSFQQQKFQTSWLDCIPYIDKAYRYLLSFFPQAIQSFDLNEYNIVVSSSHSVAHHILTHADQLHICYCHTPMRYAWDLYHQYIHTLSNPLARIYVKRVLHRMRLLDFIAAQQVDCFIANSYTTARRIKKIYQRDVDLVIYPPVDIENFQLVKEKESYFVTLSRLVPYKKIDLMIEAFRRLPNERLVVVGDGPEMRRLKEKAPLNVELIGFQNTTSLPMLLGRAKAFIFAAIEDFGIAPIEAMACGTPVIALNQGGTKETVQHNQTGIHFQEQSSHSIMDAIHQFNQEQDRFDPERIRSYATQFSKERFQEAIRNYIEKKWSDFQ